MFPEIYFTDRDASDLILQWESNVPHIAHFGELPYKTPFEPSNTLHLYCRRVPVGPSMWHVPTTRKEHVDPTVNWVNRVAENPGTVLMQCSDPHMLGKASAVALSLLAALSGPGEEALAAEYWRSILKASHQNGLLEHPFVNADRGALHWGDSLLNRRGELLRAGL